MKGIKLPNYLKETALLVWSNLKLTDQRCYSEIKKEIIKQLTVEANLDEDFHSRHQKESEGVVAFAYNLIKLAQSFSRNGRTRNEQNDSEKVH